MFFEARFDFDSSTVNLDVNEQIIPLTPNEKICLSEQNELFVYKRDKQIKLTNFRQMSLTHF